MTIAADANGTKRGKEGETFWARTRLCRTNKNLDALVGRTKIVRAGGTQLVRACSCMIIPYTRANPD